MRLPRVLTPPAISHPAGHVPPVLGRVLSVLMWPRALSLVLGCDGSGIHRVLPPLFVSHPAGHVPCVLGVLMWPRAGFGSCVAVLDAASLAVSR